MPIFPGEGDLPDVNYNLYLETVDPKNKITSLLSNEMKRLEAKKKVIDPIYNTNQRRNAQLRSMTLRKNAFSYIFLVVVIVTGLSVSLFLLKNYFPIIPDLMIDCLLVLVIGGGIIYVITLYVNIQKRDLSDFEKIDFGALIDISKSSSTSSPLDISLNSISGLSNDGGTGKDCVGEDCCPTGTYFYNNTCNKCPPGMKWNMDTKQCVLVEGFSSFSPNPSFTPL